MQQTDADQAFSMRAPAGPVPDLRVRPLPPGRQSVALVCDSMSAYGGAERVIEQVLAIFPQADVFTVMDALPDGARDFLGDRPLATSFLQRLPGGRRFYRSLLSLWPLAVEQFDVTRYDLVISSHHSVAYGVLTHPDQVHLSYVHSPMRYAWDLQHEYLQQARMTAGPKSWVARRMLHSIRQWDYCAAQRPDAIATNSDFVAHRLRRLHRRHSVTIHPPVAVAAFPPPLARAEREPFFLSVGRLVPYKRADLLMRVFADMPERRLKIVGTGPDQARLARACPPNVEVLGSLPTAEVHALLRRAQAFVFAGIEDFGITAVEAQAAGTPVIAFHRGGLVETVRGLDQQRPTGVFFHEQTEAALALAIDQFEQAEIHPEHCVANAARFSAERFRAEFAAWVGRATREARLARSQPVGSPAMAARS